MSNDNPITEAEREWHRKRAYEAAIAAENVKEATKERDPTDAERKQYAAYLAAGGPAAEPESLTRAGIGVNEAEAQGKAAARAKDDTQAHHRA